MNKMETYFAAVRYALNPEKGYPSGVESMDWDDFCEFCKRQAVLGVVFRGVMAMKEGGVEVPRKLFMKWYSMTEKTLQKNQTLNKRSVQISEFFAKAGFRSCVLKGQGNALMYPDPYSRTSGDIDLWVEGDRKAVTQLVKKYCPKSFEQYLHIDFPVFKDALVEVHYTPGKALSPFVNKRLQKYFTENISEQVNHRVSLPDGAGNISVPTDSFNVFYQMIHVMTHFFVEGVGLRHFIDYYYLLKKIGKDGCRQQDWSSLFRRYGMLRFVRGFMWVEQHVLGLEDCYLIVEPDEQRGRVILEEMLAGGNFGHYDERYEMRNKGVIARGLIDTYRLLRLTGVFPTESLWKIYRKIENQRWRLKMSRVLSSTSKSSSARSLG